MADDLRIFDVVAELLDCARVGLSETSSGVPGRSYVSMGEPAHDDCCEPPGGQLVAWWRRIYPSAAFPDDDLRPIVCQSAQTAIVVNIEVVRCAPGNDANGNPPSAATIEASAREANIDARAVWKAVLCCLRERSNDWSAIVTEQTAITPEGGCVGSRMTVTVGVLDGCECQ